MGITMIVTGRLGKPERPSFFIPKGRTYSPLPEGQRWYPSRWSGRALFSKHPPDASPEGGRQCRSFSNCRHCLCGWQRAAAPFAALQQPLVPFRDKLPPACENLPLAALPQLWTMLPRTVHFLLPRQKKQNRPLLGQKGSERLWQSIIWKLRL